MAFTCVLCLLFKFWSYMCGMKKIEKEIAIANRDNSLIDLGAEVLAVEQPVNHKQWQYTVSQSSLTADEEGYGDVVYTDEEGGETIAVHYPTTDDENRQNNAGEGWDETVIQQPQQPPEPANVMPAPAQVQKREYGMAAAPDMDHRSPDYYMQESIKRAPQVPQAGDLSAFAMLAPPTRGFERFESDESMTLYDMEPEFIRRTSTAGGDRTAETATGGPKKTPF
jgi:hypothetical protein